MPRPGRNPRARVFPHGRILYKWCFLCHCFLSISGNVFTQNLGWYQWRLKSTSIHFIMLVVIPSPVHTKHPLRNHPLVGNFHIPLGSCNGGGMNGGWAEYIDSWWYDRWFSLEHLMKHTPRPTGGIRIQRNHQDPGIQGSRVLCQEWTRADFGSSDFLWIISHGCVVRHFWICFWFPILLVRSPFCWWYSHICCLINPPAIHRCDSVPVWLNCALGKLD